MIGAKETTLYNAAESPGAEFLMKKIAILFLCAALGLAFGLASNPANAATKKHHTHHHVVKHKTRASAHVRTAQRCLAELGYHPGPIDGILGRRTTAALKAFQKDHDLHADGRLTTQTYNLLVNEAAKTKPSLARVPPPADFFATHPDFYGYYSPEYANPVLLTSPQPLSTRFGNLEISQDGDVGSLRRYSVTLEGQPLVTANHQPAPVLVSKTYAVGDEDAVLITSYSGDRLCAYVHDLLILRAQGHSLQRVENCTYAPDAEVLEGSLFISFPASNDGTPTGATWRYEGGDLEKL
jgi:peptidoglycan hydrolase-like protein with peptidoglycan-binding domain